MHFKNPKLQLSIHALMQFTMPIISHLFHLPIKNKILPLEI